MEKARELRVDPFEILLLFAKGDWKALGYPSEWDDKISNDVLYQVRIIEPRDRIVAAKEACKYIYPQRKAIDLTTDDERIDFCPIVVIPSNGRENSGD